MRPIDRLARRLTIVGLPDANRVDFFGVLEAALALEDMVIVPREATQAMHDAARDWSRNKYGKPIGKDASTGCWDIMIAAGTKP